MNYTYYLPDGMAPKAIEKILPELEYALNAKVKIEVKGKAVVLTVYNSNLLDSYPLCTKEFKDGLTVPVGYSHEGLVSLDFASDSHCYLLVGGNPGTGKSNFLNGVIHSLTTSYTPEQVILYLVDLKLGVEFGGWEKQPHTKLTAYDPATGRLRHLVDELDKKIRSRMRKFKEVDVKKISDYNKLPGVKPMPYIMLIIDEFAELHMFADDEIELKVKSLLMIGRAAGLRAIIATQRPVKDSLDTTIKALCTDRICFRVADEVNSRVILDRDGGEALPNIPGRCIFLTGADFIEVQTMLYV